MSTGCTFFSELHSEIALKYSPIVLHNVSNLDPDCSVLIYKRPALQLLFALINQQDTLWICVKRSIASLSHSCRSV